MANINISDFVEIGLGFSAEESGRFNEVWQKYCSLIGVALSGGLIILGISEMGKAGQGYSTPKKLNFSMILTGLTVGFVVTGAVCSIAKHKIQIHLSKYSSTADAIAGLTAKDRVELQNEVLKLIRMQEKINEIYNEHKYLVGSSQMA